MGGLHSTVNDLAKWVASYQSGREEEQTPYRFAQAWMAEPINELPERIVTSSYGFGLFVDDDANLGRFVHHSGGYPGFGSHMRWHPSSGWAIVALGNVTYAPMRIIGVKIMNHLAQMHLKSSSPIFEISSATEAAMKVANGLLNKWDNEIADKWFTENMDLDQPREERVAQLLKLTSGKSQWSAVDNSISAPTKSYVKWRVACEGNLLEVELLMSPEKSQRIQKLTLKTVSD
jgi:CubicO group peptidase (beta-lactamase class C family)